MVKVRLKDKSLPFQNFPIFYAVAIDLLDYIGFILNFLPFAGQVIDVFQMAFAFSIFETPTVALFQAGEFGGAAALQFIPAAGQAAAGELQFLPSCTLGVIYVENKK